MNYKSSDAGAVVGMFVLVFLLGAVAIAIFVTAVVFAIINGIALFGPDGDITSVWHWTWFVICSVVVLGNIFNRTR
jgi:hypothetical protein